MDAVRFDNVARSLIAGSSRRTLLGLVIGGIAAALGVADGEARNQRKKCKRCGPCRACKRGSVSRSRTASAAAGRRFVRAEHASVRPNAAPMPTALPARPAKGGSVVPAARAARVARAERAFAHPGRRTVKAPASLLRSAAAPAPRAKHAAPTLASARMCGTIPPSVASAPTGNAPVARSARTGTAGSRAPSGSPVSPAVAVTPASTRTTPATTSAPGSVSSTATL